MGPPPPALIQRAIATSKNASNYTAHVHADVVMRTFPFLAPSLDGTYYHTASGADKVVFTSGVPIAAEQFSQLYPQIPEPAAWSATYTVFVERRSKGETVLGLVPHQAARVQRIDVTVDDGSGEIAAYRWQYSDGYATLAQTYGNVAGHDVVTQQSGHLEIPGYTADMTAAFSGFRFGGAAAGRMTRPVNREK
jgi:hypothetical protein